VAQQRLSGHGSLAHSSPCPLRFLVRSPLINSSRLRTDNRDAVAELVSAYPTAGGMYFVTKYVTPEKHVPLASWIIGWSNFLGQTAGVTSVGYSVGQMLLAACAMGSKFDEETGTFAYTP
jgi:hypothetical protein